jgi:hypothetical protein
MTNKLSEKLFQENNLILSDTVLRRAAYTSRGKSARGQWSRMRQKISAPDPQPTPAVRSNNGKKPIIWSSLIANSQLGFERKWRTCFYPRTLLYDRKAYNVLQIKIFSE